MEINQIHNILLETDDNIMSTTIASPNELVLLLSSGDVVRYDIEKQEQKHLFSVLDKYQKSFDIQAKSSIYTLDDIVVVVNNFKTAGCIYNPKKYGTLFFEREDYHANISLFPIVLFKNENNDPLLIYAQAWNHLQVMNVDTRQENAEKDHIEFYKNHEEHNKFLWPRSYDYFFDELKISPDKKNFLSLGWVWGSFDAYNVYDLEHFITDNRIRDKNLGAWEHNHRSACWVDEKKIAVAYNPNENWDEETPTLENAPQELHIYTIDKEEPAIEKKLKIENLDIVNSHMYFNNSLDAFIIFSTTIGVAIITLDGQLLLHNSEMMQDAYCPDTNLFIRTEGTSINIHQIKME